MKSITFTPAKNQKPKDLTFPRLMERIDNPRKIVMFTEERFGYPVSGFNWETNGLENWISCTDSTTWKPTEGTVTFEF